MKHKITEDAIEALRETLRKQRAICPTDSVHEWVTDPNSHGLIDVCKRCGAERA